DRPHQRRRALRPGRCGPSGGRPCAQRDRPRQQPRRAEEGRLPLPRRARPGAQEGRTEEGAQGAAVLQALIPHSRSALQDGSREGPRPTWSGAFVVPQGRGDLAASAAAHTLTEQSQEGDPSHMSRLFGTDGVRGLANRDITARLALQLAVAGSRVLARPEHAPFGKRPVAIVGRDTRVSGEFLAASTSAGIASTGVDVQDVGVLPTPGIAHAVKATGATFGVVISASHNAMPDNGIKFFGQGGTKLTDAQEDEILALLDQEWDRPTGAEVGRIAR